MVKIKVENLYKVFGSNPQRAVEMVKKGKSKDEIYAKTKCAVGVSNANFEINQGETLVVMGLSGSGKSTLMRCLNRLHEPTAGKVIVDGVDVTQLDQRELLELRRNKFGMVFQRFALFPHRTVRENVEYGLEIKSVAPEVRREKTEESLELVGLKGWGEAYPAQLSGGMQQRVGLARALAIDPDILLMDEAFSALDPLIRTEMQDELLKLESQVQKTIVFVTHDLDEALKMGDRIVLMKDGVIVQIGTPEEILTHPADEYVSKFIENVDITKVLTAGDVMVQAEVTFLKDGPRTALHMMKEEGLNGIFVVRQNHELVGYVTADRCAKAVKEGQTQLHLILEEYERQKVNIDTPVRDLFVYIVDDSYPVAVIDHSDKLVGRFVRGSVLAALAERSAEYHTSAEEGESNG